MADTPAQPTPEFTRGPAGDPNNPPAPYGEATAVNAAAAQIPQTPETQSSGTPSNPPSREVPGVSGNPPPQVPTPAMDSENRKFLFAPTDRPNEPVTAGVNPDGTPTPPPDLMDWLPALREAANIPDAPPQVRLLYETISQTLGS